MRWQRAGVLGVVVLVAVLAEGCGADGQPVADRHAVQQTLGRATRELAKGDPARVCGELTTAGRARAVAGFGPEGDLPHARTCEQVVVGQRRLQAGTIRALAHARIDHVDARGDLARARIRVGLASETLYLRRTDGRWAVETSSVIPFGQ